MINVRKLRVLQRKGEEMERQKVVEKTRKYLQSVGDRIKEVAADEPQRRDIWKASFLFPSLQYGIILGSCISIQAASDSHHA